MKANRTEPVTNATPKLLVLARLLWSNIKNLINIFKLLLNRIFKFNQQWNEAWLLVAGYFALQFVPVFLPVPTHRFFYASLGTVCAHFLVSLMLRLSHPYIFRYLYGLFYTDLYESVSDLKSNTLLEEKKHTRMKYTMLVILLYLGTWLILAVTF